MTHSPPTLDQKLHEAYHALLSDYVDPAEPFFDDDQRWLPLGSANGRASIGLPLASETSLAQARNQSRALALENEFAINALENRISYIVGSGYKYEAVAARESEQAKALSREVQQVVDEFLEENNWPHRQQEIVRRHDRDGEVFLRLFADPAGMLRVRFVEPEQIAAPTGGDPSTSFGIQTEPDDVETVLGYYIDGDLAPADQIQHRKANVDCNSKRGLPLLYPVRKNLRRAEKLLRNMSILAEVQSAIALIRKHRSTTRGGVEQFVSGQAAATYTDSAGATQRVTRFGPGAILDAPANLEYDFPASAINAGNYVTILQAELRAIASRLVMPEFMLTADASNGNYASTLVAEGPAVKMFTRMQATHRWYDRWIMRRVLEHAVASGRLPEDVQANVAIQIEPPSVATRNQREEAMVNRIAFEAGILSRQTWSMKMGLDYPQEQKNLEKISAPPSP